MNSLQYLPQGLQDQELYQFLCDCIDFVATDAASPETLVFRSDDILLPEYVDAEAVNAYYLKCIYPLIGTRWEMDRLLELFGVNGRLFEWFEYDPPLPTYAWEVMLLETPRLASVTLLYNLLNRYKNERSNLRRVYQLDNPYCEDVLMLSVPDMGNTLDRQTLSLPTGHEIDGAYFCFASVYGKLGDSSITVLDGYARKRVTAIEASIPQPGFKLDALLLDDGSDGSLSSRPEMIGEFPLALETDEYFMTGSGFGNTYSHRDSRTASQAVIGATWRTARTWRTSGLVTPKDTWNHTPLNVEGFHWKWEPRAVMLQNGTAYGTAYSNGLSFTEAPSTTYPNEVGTLEYYGNIFGDSLPGAWWNTASGPRCDKKNTNGTTTSYLPLNGVRYLREYLWEFSGLQGITSGSTPYMANHFSGASNWLVSGQYVYAPFRKTIPGYSVPVPVLLRFDMTNPSAGWVQQTPDDATLYSTGATGVWAKWGDWIYMVGHLSNNYASKKTSRINVITGVLQENVLTLLPQAGMAKATFVHGDYLYIIYGSDNSGFMRINLNFPANAWDAVSVPSPIPPYPNTYNTQLREDTISLTVYNGYLYLGSISFYAVADVTQNHSKHTARLNLNNLASGWDWVGVPDLPKSVFGARTVQIGSKWYLIGGTEWGPPRLPGYNEPYLGAMFLDLDNIGAGWKEIKDTFANTCNGANLLPGYAVSWAGEVYTVDFLYNGQTGVYTPTPQRLVDLSAQAAFWKIVAVGNMSTSNLPNKNTDLVFYNSSTFDLQLVGTTGIAATSAIGPIKPYPTIPAALSNYRFIGTAAFTKNGGVDLVYQETTGNRRLHVLSIDVNHITGYALLDYATDMGLSFTSLPAEYTIDAVVDGRDLVVRNTITGANFIWILDGFQVQRKQVLPAQADLSWSILAIGDFDNDDTIEVLWKVGTSGLVCWKLTADFRVAQEITFPTIPTSFVFVGVGNLAYYGNNSLGDILWKNTVTQEITIWRMTSWNAGTIDSSDIILTASSTVYPIAIDPYSTGTAQLLGYHTNNYFGSWPTNNTGMVTGAFTSSELTDIPTMVPIGIGAFSSSRKKDLVFFDATTYSVRINIMNTFANGSATTLRSAVVHTFDSDNWHLIGIGDLNNDDLDDLLFYNSVSGEVFGILLSTTTVLEKGTIPIGSTSKNLCKNPNYFDGMVGWSMLENTIVGDTIVSGVNHSVPWNLEGGKTFWFSQVGSTSVGANTYVDFASDPIPVVAGKKYEAFTHIGTHRCLADFYVLWEAQDDSVVGTSTFAGVPDTIFTGGKFITGYQFTIPQTDGNDYIIAPQGAIKARLVYRKHATTGGFGYTSSYLFATACYFGVYGEAQTQHTDWSEAYSTFWLPEDTGSYSSAGCMCILWRNRQTKAIRLSSFSGLRSLGWNKSTTTIASSWTVNGFKSKQIRRFGDW